MAAESNPIETLFERCVLVPLGALTDPARTAEMVADGRKQVEQQIATARMIGQFAVTMGRAELDKRLDGLRAQRAARQPAPPTRPTPAPTDVVSAVSDPQVEVEVEIDVRGATPTVEAAAAAPAKAPAKKAATKKAAAKKAAAKKGSAKKAAATKAPAKKAAPDPVEVAPVEVLTVDEPIVLPVGELAIAEYDALAASQVVARLDGLSAEELEAVRRYEIAHRGRKTILGKVAQLQAP